MGSAGALKSSLDGLSNISTALRFDRLITLSLAQPVQHVFRRLRMLSARPASFSGSFPILMYHSITDDPEPGVGGYYRLNTPPSLFREHLRMIRDEGFSIVDLAEALRMLKDESKSSNENGRRSRATSDRHPSKLAVLTFDDGFRDFLTAAWPSLAEFGFKSTVFLPTAFIGRERRMFKTRECLTWDEVRELRRQGVRFGSHTVNHPKLWELEPAAFVSELRESRQTLEDKLGESIDSFAHPYAFPRTNAAYIHRFRETLTESGYRLGVTTSLGCARPGDDPLLLKRLPANGADDAALFRAKLYGAYDWLAGPQDLIKRAKAVSFC
jgi:peptidoglycan/xylan/chitin deacetylase (PgdA/CDA1 family)